MLLPQVWNFKRTITLLAVAAANAGLTLQYLLNGGPFLHTNLTVAGLAILFLFDTAEWEYNKLMGIECEV
jgi:hypothetical protein